MNKELSFRDLWNPNIILSADQLDIIMECIKRVHPAEMEIAKDLYDRLDEIYYRVLIKHELENFAMLKNYLQGVIDATKRTIPELNIEGHGTFPEMLNKRAAFLKWMIEESSQYELA